MPSDPHQPALQAIETWRAGGATFDWNGQDIWYRDEGGADRPVLVMIHGFPTASWDWHKVWQPLAARYRLIACDMLGFGSALKMLLLPTDLLPTSLTRDEIVALFNTVSKFSCPLWHIGW